MIHKSFKITYEAALIIEEKLQGVNGFFIEPRSQGMAVKFGNCDAQISMSQNYQLEEEVIGYYLYNSDQGVFKNVCYANCEAAAELLASAVVGEIKEILNANPERDEKIIAEIASAIIYLFFYDFPNSDFSKFKLKLSEDGNLKILAKSREMIVIRKLFPEDIAYNAGLSLGKVQEQLPFLKLSDLNF